MIIVKFTKNPDKTLWIGWAEYENGTYFASGRTMDKLVARMKMVLWSSKGVSARQVYLDTKQSSEYDAPVEKMSNMFRGKYWKSNRAPSYPTSIAVVPLGTTPVSEKKNTPTPVYDYYEYKVNDGRLVVYGIMRREVNSFDLRKNQSEGGDNGGNE